jgi:hypothetical protein
LQTTDFTTKINFNKVRQKYFYHISHFSLKNEEMFDISQIKTKKFLGKNPQTSKEHYTHKPIGIWFAKGKEWINELDNMFGFDENNNNIYQVNPNFQCYYDHPDPNKILYIENEEQLVDFIIKFKSADNYGPSVSLMRWDIVSKKYAGVYFACRNQYPRWLSPSWFAALDVNSGCCWRMTGFTNWI